MAERDFLRKPFDLKLLTARVRQALDAVQPRRP
jgi:DNA-binding response OmpR family regulator